MLPFSIESVMKLVEQYIYNNLWREAYDLLSSNWAVLSNEHNDWLLGESGVVYRLPEAVCHSLLKKFSVSHKVIMRPTRHERPSNKKPKKTKLSSSDVELIERRLGYSNNSIHSRDREGQVVIDAYHGGSY